MSKPIKISLFLFIIGITFFTSLWHVSAKTNSLFEKNLVNLYFFHSNTCSHCAEEEKLLTKLEKKYANLKIYRYEIHTEEAQKILEVAEEVYFIQVSGVPLTIIGEEVYQGYSGNKSKLTFIQTIEYYSKYNYQDRLGEEIGIPNLPSLKTEAPEKTLEEFKEEYGIYKIIGSLTTKSLDANLIAILTGILSNSNFLFFLSLIPIFFLLKKKDLGWRKESLLLTIYFSIHFLLFTTSVIKNTFYIIAIMLLIFSLFFWELVKYYKNKKKQYAILNLLLILAITVNSFNRFFVEDSLQILFQIDHIYLLDGLNRFTYYANYIFSAFLIQILLTIILTVVVNKGIQKFSERRM